MFSEDAFLSPYGLRALSQRHRDAPFSITVDGVTATVDYEPAESTTGLFGGNSNWRGPIWFPVNYLLIEALQRFHTLLRRRSRSSTRPVPASDSRSPRSPTTSPTGWSDLPAGRRGRRPVYGANELFQCDPHWRDLLLFHEYFHGDTGNGIGASHQTGWTGIVAHLLVRGGSLDETAGLESIAGKTPANA